MMTPKCSIVTESLLMAGKSLTMRIWHPVCTTSHRRSCMGKYKPQERYDQQNTRQIRLKLNIKTDKDILERLDKVGNKQGYIKDLIRADINK